MEENDPYAMALTFLMLLLLAFVIARVWHVLAGRAAARASARETLEERIDGIAFDKAQPKPRWHRPLNNIPIALTEDEVRFIWAHAQCPYCHSMIFEGPTGGLSVNVFCGNPECNSRFNVTIPGFVGIGGNSSAIPPVGEFIGKCPEDFLEMRRQQQPSQIRNRHNGGRSQEA